MVIEKIPHIHLNSRGARSAINRLTNFTVVYYLESSAASPQTRLICLDCSLCQVQ